MPPATPEQVFGCQNYQGKPKTLQDMRGGIVTEARRRQLVVATNVLVRYLTDDGTAQAVRARRLLAQHDVFVPLSVLLETEWVPRAVFDFAAVEVAGALRAFAGLPRVSVENPEAISTALVWAERGLDFADALDLAAPQGHDGFVAFDKALARTARRLGLPPCENHKSAGAGDPPPDVPESPIVLLSPPRQRGAGEKSE